MISRFFYQLISSLFRNIGGDVGIILRRKFYILSGMKIGRNATIREGVMIYRPYNIEIGEGSEIGFGCVLSAVKKIKIGKDVGIGPYTSIYDNGHKMPKSNEEENLISDIVKIGDSSWIGTHSTILMGVKIGKNTTIGAGSVVLKDVPDNAVVVGNPARIIKYNQKNNE